MPGYERAELSAELTVTPSDGEPLEALRRAAGETGLAHEAGPETVALSGDREAVFAAATEVAGAALEAGARTVDVRFEAEGDAPRFEEGE